MSAAGTTRAVLPPSSLSSTDTRGRWTSRSFYREPSIGRSSTGILIRTGLPSRRSPWPQFIRSLSEFKRNTVGLLDRLRKTGHPLVLTINGKAELVVQDAAAYQALLDRVEAIEGIQQGLADVKAGRTKPARQVFARLRRKHGIPR